MGACDDGMNTGQTLRILPRFFTPPVSANGGYFAGPCDARRAHLTV
jgi:hypothetical protein